MGNEKFWKILHELKYPLKPIGGMGEASFYY
jgi:hypothetical protein